MKKQKIESEEVKLIKAENFKKDIWKEFIKLKFFEIIIAIGVIPILIFIPYYLGRLLEKWGGNMICSDGEIPIVCTNTLIWVGGLMILTLVSFLIFWWITANWDWAKERVVERGMKSKEINLKEVNLRVI